MVFQHLISGKKDSEVRKDEEFIEIVWDIYRDMYLVADPPADFDELVRSGGEFYNKHFISEKDFDEIISNNLNGKRLKDVEKTKIINTVTLGCSPKFK